MSKLVFSLLFVVLALHTETCEAIWYEPNCPPTASLPSSVEDNSTEVQDALIATILKEKSLKRSFEEYSQLAGEQVTAYQKYKMWRCSAQREGVLAVLLAIERNNKAQHIGGTDSEMSFWEARLKKMLLDSSSYPETDWSILQDLPKVLAEEFVKSATNYAKDPAFAFFQLIETKVSDVWDTVIELREAKTSINC